ncbi:hypothetical protein ABZY45_24390 [Streptomyces sp. NPDC006516]|uniref:hypothetical protein n=1 Tax=Streptomyces sp. NPDC006516 TaxID=3154309 RepID=UPI0033B10A33
MSLFDPANEWVIGKGQGMRRGYEWLKKPEMQSELLGERYEDVAELSGGTCKIVEALLHGVGGESG